MDLVIAGSTRLRAVGNDALSRVSIELSADALEVGVGSIVIDDPAGTDADSTGRQCKVSEGIALLSDGFLAMDDTARGIEPAQPHREDTWQVQDANVLLYGRRFVNRSRPAETDRARVLAFAALDVTADTTFVLNTNTVTLPAKVYTGSDWTELMQDVFEAAGKSIFLHDKTDGSGRCLHSHLITEGHTCGLTISDVPSAANSTTFAPHHPNRNRSAGILANNVYGRDQDNRNSSASDATSITTHDADGLKHQTIVEFEATSQADLDAKTSAYLAENKEDEYIYTCSIGPLDQAALRLIRPGDRITVTSQAMGLSASAIRIAHMTLTPSVGADGTPIVGLWDAALELQNPIRIRGRRGATSGSKPATVNDLHRLVDPHDPACVTTTVDDLSNRTLHVTGAWAAHSNAFGASSGGFGTWTIEDNLGFYGKTNDFVDITASVATFHREPRVLTNPSGWYVNLVPTGSAPWETDYHSGKLRFQVNRVGTGAGGLIGHGVTFDIGDGLMHIGIDSSLGEVRVFSDTTVAALAKTVWATNAWYIAELEVNFPAGYVRGRVYLESVGPTMGWDVTVAASTFTEVAGVAPFYSVGGFNNDPTNSFETKWTLTTIVQCVAPITGATVEDVGFYGDGTTTAFTTAMPYKAGTLKLLLDGLPDLITETNPATGAYTFATAPKDDEFAVPTYGGA